MTSLINRFLQTGRLLNAAEEHVRTLQLAGDPAWRKAAEDASALQTKQTAQVSDALKAGVDLDTIEFALALHGQGADRDQYRGQPTAADLILKVVTVGGLEGLDEVIEETRKALGIR